MQPWRCAREGNKKPQREVAVLVVGGRQSADGFLFFTGGILGEDLAHEFFNFFVFLAYVFIKIAFNLALPEQLFGFRVGEINEERADEILVDRVDAAAAHAHTAGAREAAGAVDGNLSAGARGDPDEEVGCVALGETFEGHAFVDRAEHAFFVEIGERHPGDREVIERVGFIF